MIITYPYFHNLIDNIVTFINKEDARDKHVLTMLEKIKLALMKRMHTNFSNISKQTRLLCPKIQEILEKTKEEASPCIADWVGSPRFQVQGPSGTFVCDLEVMMCMYEVGSYWYTLYAWVTTMTNCGLEPKEFVNIYYHMETYLRCYRNFIEPLNRPHLWEKTCLLAILPPVYGAQVERKNKRKLEIQDEKEGNATKLGKKHQNS